MTIAYGPWVPPMGEMTGRGGDYEDAARRMLYAGIDWHNANPAADPQFIHDGAGVYGPSNPDGASMEAAMVVAAGVDYVKTLDDPFMHQISIDHVLWLWDKQEWGQYVAFLVRRETASPASLGHSDSKPRGNP